MKTVIKIVFLLFIGIEVVSARGYLTRVGVLNPFTNTDDSLMAIEAVRSIRDALHTLGRYDVYTQKRMVDAYEVIDNHFPEFCHEPRCAAVLGSSLQLERMLYGDVIFSQNRYAVELTLVDVFSREIINTCSVEGGEGASLADVVTGALYKLHESDTLLPPTPLVRYYGEAVDKKKPMFIATGAYMGTGLLYALIGNDRQDTWVRQKDKLTGIDPSMKSVAQSARARALGNCYVALAKDAYGAFYNPAGASWVDGPEASFNYQSRYGLVSTYAASFVAKATREIGWGHTFQYSGGADTYYHELYFSSLFSYRFTDFDVFPPFSLGATVHVSSARTDGGSGSKYDQTGTAAGFGLDLGFLIALSPKIDFGLTFSNVPSLVYYNNGSSSEKEIDGASYTEYRYRENRPASVKLGGTYTVNYATLLIAEGEIPLYPDQLWRFAGGLEQQLFGSVFLRMGASKEVFATYDTPWRLTVGAGIKVPLKQRNLFLDGAYEISTDLELRHVWDVSVRIDL